MPILQVDGLSHSFGERHVLRNLSLSIDAGESVALLGANGSGKSTLLRLVAGLLTPTSGRINLVGSAAAAGRPEVGIVFQEARLLPWRTVLRNVTLPLELAGEPLATARATAEAALARVSAGGLVDRNPAEISGGERGRVALARALVRRPSLLLLDEPFAALDAITRARLDDELPELVAGAATLLVTHDVAEALLVADRVLMLGADGAIALEVPGFRSLPSAGRRAALLSPDGAARQTRFYAALDSVAYA
jgi:ABC-type nitrate/sulfonate/bicarbonate transport system ATPase subunit